MTPRSAVYGRLLGPVVASLMLFAGTWALADQPSNGGTLDPIGEWLTAKRYATIRIADCNGHLWGVVASETYPTTDSKNPDPSLRNRPSLGMPILLALTKKKSNEWDGQIYNSQDGHTYSASITMLAPNTLRVEGCFLGFLCGGENWTRVEPQDMSKATPGLNTTPPTTNQPSRKSPNPAQFVCLSVFGPTWLAHQRGLK